MGRLLLEDRENLIRKLEKRIRELEYVHDIFNTMTNLNTPLDKILQDIAERVPRGFPHPNCVGSCPSVADKTARTPEFTNISPKLDVGINFNVFSENALIGVYQTNLKGDILYANHACLQIFGFDTPEEAGAKGTPTCYRYPEDRKTVLKILEKTGNLNNFELEMVTKTEQPIVVLLSASLDSDIITGMIMDITENKHIENSLRMNRRNLDEAQRIAHLGSWEWHFSTGAVTCSDEAYRIFGEEPRQIEVTYDIFLDRVHPDDRPMVDQSAREVLADQKRESPVEHRIILPDGQERIVQLRGEVSYTKDRKPMRMIGTVLDITKSKHTEKTLEKALEEIQKLKDQLAAENIYLRNSVESYVGNDDIIGISNPVKYVIHRIRQVARTKTTVLLRGKTGSGKGIFARFLHKESDRWNKPLVQVNCAALPANLIESELFGREKGAFTGSTERQRGRFEIADKGTIFLDEIGELPIELQAKLLKILEDGTFERLGSPNTIKIDVRIIASTNRNLEEEIAKGRFRQDLFYRLNVFPITIPSLSQRKEDIPLLVTHFTQKFSRTFNKKINKIPKIIMNEFEDYDWPGNVRELINVIERAVIVSEGDELLLADMFQSASVCPVCDDNPADTPAPEFKKLVDMERENILKTLRKTAWRLEGVHGAAKILDINPNTLRSRMKKLGIKKPPKE